MRSVLVVFVLLTLSFSVFSQSNKKIKELERKRKLAMQEIENTTQLLKESKKTTANLLNRINLISEQISSRQNLISLLNQEVTAITEQQAITEKEIKKLEVDLKDQQKAYGKAVESIVLKKQNTNKLVFVLSGKSLGESLRRMKYLRDYSEWRNEQIVGIREKQKELQEKRAALEKSKKDKMSLLDTRQKEQSNLQSEENTHKQEVQEANKKQSELQNLLKRKQKQADNLNAQIERLIKEEVARQEREAKRLAAEQAKKEKARKERERKEAERRARANKPGETSKPSTAPKEKETKTETERMNDAPPVTKENFKLSSNFAANKGKLPVPVTGRYRIIGRFGTHQHNRWNVKTNSSGIDIQAQSGAQARSVFDGEVSRIVAFPGYNNCIIVRHGGYYTFYGNIQHVTVRQGQKVSAGQSLGSVYTDSDTGSSQLHFQLWKGTTKLNPEPWLRK